MKPALSAVLIAQDEEADLPGALESVRGLADEIIVLDGGSGDRTMEVARRYTSRVSGRPFTEFAEQKQAALDLASGEWVLSIDADERVTPELGREISELLRRPPPDAGYLIPFQVKFMGRHLRFGGMGSEKHLRLFRREAGRFVGGKLHEGIEVRGSIGRLRRPIEHVPYRDLDDYLDKLSRYTTLAARKRLERGERFTPFHHLLPAWEFFVRTVIRLGALDGTAGVAWAGLSSFHTWVKYLKLREMQ